MFRIGNTDDLQRIYYYKHYINQVLKAIKEVKIKLSYDQVEWGQGAALFIDKNSKLVLLTVQLIPGALTKAFKKYSLASGGKKKHHGL